MTSERGRPFIDLSLGFGIGVQGMSSLVEWDPLLETAISSSKMLVVEGYLWELPETVNAIARACVAAKAKGVMVALTASDVSCVLRFRQQFWCVFFTYLSHGPLIFIPYLLVCDPCLEILIFESLNMR